jgi:hypothetical protein
MAPECRALLLRAPTVPFFVVQNNAEVVEREGELRIKELTELPLAALLS